MSENETIANRNFRLVGLSALVAGAMFGFGFAIAPMYSLICEWAGIGGKAQTAAIPEIEYKPDYSRELGMEFITSVNESTPMRFWVEKPKLRINPGQYYSVKFYATNLSNKKLIGRAVPSVAPPWVTQFLIKTECFCFSEQAFEPGQTRELPVRFVIDNEFPADVKDLTLSYTFFDITGKQGAN